MTQETWGWQPAPLAASQEAGLPGEGPSRRWSRRPQGGSFLDAQDLMGLGWEALATAKAESMEP